MIGRRITIGINLALVAGLGTLGWLYRAEIKQSAQLAQTVIQQRTTLDEMSGRLAEAERQRKKARAVAAKYKQRVDQIRANARNLRDEIRRLEKQNAEVRKWADADMPGPVVDLLMHPGKDGGQD